MTKVPTAQVPRSFLKLLFDELEIWAKIKNGHLSSKCNDPVASHGWADGSSYIIRHYKPNGKHVATSHCVKDKTGEVVHWDAKDLMVNDVRLFVL